MDLAAKVGAPVIGLNDSGGARIQEGVDALAGYSDIFLKNVLYSGVVPQISLILGPCAGGAVYSPAITDFVGMTRGTSYMFLTGPKVVKQVTRESVTTEQLGGADIHATQERRRALRQRERRRGAGPGAPAARLPPAELPGAARRPSRARTPIDRANPELNAVLPDSPNQPYDVKDVIRSIVDDGDFLEVHEAYAPNLVVGFARFNGQPGGHRGQPAEGARGRARQRVVDQGRAVRALLRRVQHPARHARGRAGLHAGHGRRSTAASSATGPSCSSRSRRRRCRRSRSSCARPTAAPTAS